MNALVTKLQIIIKTLIIALTIFKSQIQLYNNVYIFQNINFTKSLLINNIIFKICPLVFFYSTTIHFTALIIIKIHINYTLEMKIVHFFKNIANFQHYLLKIEQNYNRTLGKRIALFNHLKGFFVNFLLFNFLYLNCYKEVQC